MVLNKSIQRQLVQCVISEHCTEDLLFHLLQGPMSLTNQYELFVCGRMHGLIKKAIYIPSFHMPMYVGVLTLWLVYDVVGCICRA